MPDLAKAEDVRPGSGPSSFEPEITGRGATGLHLEDMSDGLRLLADDIDAAAEEMTRESTPEGMSGGAPHAILGSRQGLPWRLRDLARTLRLASGLAADAWLAERRLAARDATPPREADSLSHSA